MVRSKQNKTPKKLSRVRRIFRIFGWSLFALFVLNLGYFSIQTVIRSNTAHEDLGMAAADVARDIGYGPLMAISENIYYQVINPAQVGGNPNGPAVFNKVVDSGATSHLGNKISSHNTPIVANNSAWGPAIFPSSVTPKRVVSPAKNKVTGEGVWEPTKIRVDGQVAVMVARVRPDAIHTSFFDTLVWMDPKLLAFQEIPGTIEPTGNYNHGSGTVPKKLKKFYVAGINGGYKTVNMHGGFIYNGQKILPMKKDAATLLTYPDGSIDIRNWGLEPIRGGYLSARQNLPMLVDRGINQVRNNNDAQWGSPLWGTSSGSNYVWRSAIGVRADGTVIHLVGPSLSQSDLADLMVRAGAVRAMCLDMNNGWASSYFYGPYRKGVPMDPQITHPVSRFIDPSTRDFLAVYIKSPARAAKTSSQLSNQNVKKGK